MDFVNQDQLFYEYHLLFHNGNNDYTVFLAYRRLAINYFIHRNARLNHLFNVLALGQIRTEGRRSVITESRHQRTTGRCVLLVPLRISLGLLLFHFQKYGISLL